MTAKSRGVRIDVPSRGSRFLGKTHPEKVVRLGSAFLAGAFVFWAKHDQKKPSCSGSAFLAGAFVFWEKHDLEKNCPSRISVPRRGFCFLGKTRSEKSRGARVGVPSRGPCFPRKHDLKKPWCSGRRSEQGLLFFGTNMT